MIKSVRELDPEELTTLAAHAARISVPMVRSPGSWNPLGNPGQALMLAVKLNMQFGVEGDVINAWSNEYLTNFQTVERAHFGDEVAACRAIVLCAAETGRRMS